MHVVSIHRVYQHCNGPGIEANEADFSFIYSNQQLQNIVRTAPLRNIIHAQHLRYIGHVCRTQNTNLTKKMLFAKPQRKNYRDPWPKYADLLSISIHQMKKLTQSRSDLAERIRTCIHSPP